MGLHCIKAWSSTQGAVALSSAEAEFYAMIDAVLKARWVVTVAKEMGFEDMMPNLILGTDSAAPRSFVSRRGLGKMRHIEVRGLSLQREVLRGQVQVRKIPRESNPSDLLTKYLHVDAIKEHLNRMSIEVVQGNRVKQVSKKT